MSASPAPKSSTPEPQRIPLIVASWAWVLIPLAYGVYELILKATQLFTD